MDSTICTRSLKMTSSKDDGAYKILGDIRLLVVENNMSHLYKCLGVSDCAEQRYVAPELTCRNTKFTDNSENFTMKSVRGLTLDFNGREKAEYLRYDVDYDMGGINHCDTFIAVTKPSTMLARAVLFSTNTDADRIKMLAEINECSDLMHFVPGYCDGQTDRRWLGRLGISLSSAVKLSVLS